MKRVFRKSEAFLSGPGALWDGLSKIILRTSLEVTSPSWNIPSDII